jgi:hypothetical protein
VELEKIKVILNFPTLSLQKHVRSFLGYVGYYCHFIEMFSQISCLLFSLLIKYSKFLWTKIFQNALDELKTKVSEAPILRGLDWSPPFHISTDASYTTIGVILGKLEGKDPYEIYYIRKNLSHAKLNYMVI